MPSSAWSSDVCRSEDHTSELQSLTNLVCRLLLEKKLITHSLSPNAKTTLPKSTHITALEGAVIIATPVSRLCTAGVVDSFSGLSLLFFENLVTQVFSPFFLLPFPFP